MIRVSDRSETRLGRLTLLAGLAVAAIVQWTPAARANDDPPKAAAAQEKAPASQGRPDVAPLFGQPGNDPPRPFVPLRASTVADRQRTEALRLYAAARGLEDRRLFNEAVALLQQAQKLDPESVAIPRRLTKLYLGALGRPDQAVEYGKKVLAVEPGDTDTLSRLVEYYNRLGNLAATEALLKEDLANPRLERHSAGRLLAQYELGKLYANRLSQIENAANAFAEVLSGLDDKAANRLSPLDQARILGSDPAATYLSFGIVFLAAKKEDLAVKAFERGLVYDEENAQIPLLLAETLLKQDKGPRALALVERYIKRQPQSLDAYELLAKVLTALKRDAEITPRLEEAARRDSKNAPLQYVLADRYRETGQIDKAEALYKQLLTSQPTPQTYRALAASLLKRKKAADLVRVMSEAIDRKALEAVSAQLQAVVRDDQMSEAMLDAGLEQIQAGASKRPQPAYNLLMFLAHPEVGPVKPKRLERFLKIERAILAQNPPSRVYTELADTLRKMDQNDEAARVLEQMMAKFPNEKNGRYLSALADLQRRAGRIEDALKSARSAASLDPNEVDTQLVLADLLGETGKVDEALDIFRKTVKNEPNNPRFQFLLGGTLAKFGRNDEAVRVFNDLLKAFGANDEIAKLAHSNLSIVYVNQGDYARGESELEIVFQKSPDDPGVNNDLGYLYAEQGKNLEKAEAMIRRAVREEPDRAAYLDSLGWVLFKRGKVKEALEPLQKAIELQKAEEKKGASPPDATIREHLGDVFLQLKQVDKARKLWEEAEQVAAKAVPPDKRLAEIRKKLASLKALGSIPKSPSNDTP